MTEKVLKGLTSEEVELRKSQDKVNNAKKIKTNSIGRIIIKNVFSFVNILLIVIAVILFSFGLWTNFGFVVVFGGNLIISLFSDIRAKLAVDKLSLVTENHSIVIRDGKEIEISDKEIVLNEVIKIKQGAVIPCDSVILDGTLLVDESILTGESDLVEKKIGDKVLSGTTVMSGVAYIETEKVGNDCYINQLESQTKIYKTTRPELYKQINLLFRGIMIAVAILGISQILSIVLRNTDSIDSYSEFAHRIVEPIAGSILSLIPSGLYFLFSTTLAVGVINLSKNKILVQDLYSLDVLSRVDVICIDKTGTITDSSMKVVDFVEFEKNNGLLEGFSLKIGSFLANTKDSNATNLAMREYFKVNDLYKCTNSLPFDSINKYSAMEFDDGTLICCGAYEFMPLINESDHIQEMINDKAKKGFRVITVAFGKGKIVDGKIEGELEAKAMVVLEDNIKKDAKEIINYFKEKGVRVLIVSGDNNLTLQKIAEDVDLASEIKSIDLSKIKEDEIPNLVDEINVYGRVTPEQKRLIVKALKEKGHTVAMFGDGVNDILAFKEANISLSVQAGTPAARSLAKIIFLDNNFGGMVEVVKEGRRVINNLQRTASLFLVKTTFAALINSFFIIMGLVKGIERPFIPGSFYMWEIGFVGMSAFFLSLEPKSEIIKGNFIKNVLKEAIPAGSVIAIGIISVYLYMIYGDFYEGNAILHRAVATLIMNCAAFIVLIKVCLPFNKFRALVALIGTSIAAGILVWSIYGPNWMGLYPKEAPRYLPTDALNVALIFGAAIWAALIILYVTKYLISKKKGKAEK